MIRDHLRSNAIGYLALFVALSGTAVAAHPGGADTISSEDIIQGEVRSSDLSNTDGVRSLDVRDDTFGDGGLAAVDLAADSVGRSELLGGAVGTFEIGVDQVLSRNIAVEEVNSADLADNSVNARELVDNIIDDSDVVADAIGISEIAPDSVGGSELISNQVGGGELSELHEVASAFEFVEDGIEHDGAYGKGTATAICPPGEELLDASIDWTDDEDHNETAIAEIVIERTGDDSATVSGIFDGGGGAGNTAAFQAYATCIRG